MLPLHALRMSTCAYSIVPNLQLPLLRFVLLLRPFSTHACVLVCALNLALCCCFLLCFFFILLCYSWLCCFGPREKGNAKRSKSKSVLSFQPKISPHTRTHTHKEGRKKSISKISPCVGIAVCLLMLIYTKNVRRRKREREKAHKICWYT